MSGSTEIPTREVGLPGPLRENLPVATRLQAIDIARGFIMVVMSLDHCRDAVGGGNNTHGSGVGREFYHSSPYSATITFSLFFTRYITHLAAPGFFFLMGVGMAFLYSSRIKKGWSHLRIVSHLAIRGALLILIEFTLITTAWFVMGKDWNFKYFLYFHLLVLTSLGFSMIFVTILIPLYWKFSFENWNPLNRTHQSEIEQEQTEEVVSVEHQIGCGKVNCLGWISFFIVSSVAYSVGSLIILNIPEDPTDSKIASNVFLSILFFPSYNAHVNVLYPLMNWFAVTLAGFTFGHLLLETQWRAWVMKYGCFIIGALLLLLFTVLRICGPFFTLELPGETYWKHGVLDFLYIIKYPPSMVFLLANVGILFIVIGVGHNVYLVVENSSTPWVSKVCYPVTEVLLNFGKASLFFYIVHLWWFTLVSLLVSNLDLGGVYAIWLISLTPLYLLCLKYGKFKHTTPPNSIWRFF